MKSGGVYFTQDLGRNFIELVPHGEGEKITVLVREDSFSEYGSAVYRFSLITQSVQSGRRVCLWKMGMKVFSLTSLPWKSGNEKERPMGALSQFEFFFFREGSSLRIAICSVIDQEVEQVLELHVTVAVYIKRTVVNDANALTEVGIPIRSFPACSGAVLKASSVFKLVANTVLIFVNLAVAVTVKHRSGVIAGGVIGIGCFEVIIAGILYGTA